MSAFAMEPRRSPERNTCIDRPTQGGQSCASRCRTSGIVEKEARGESDTAHGNCRHRRHNCADGLLRRGSQAQGDTLQVVDADPVDSWPTRRYVEHLWDGVQDGATGPVEWSCDWTAPAQGLGTVLFYAAGNAANGSYEPSGDWIYTTADSMRDSTTAVVARSWGAIKARWR